MVSGSSTWQGLRLDSCLPRRRCVRALWFILPNSLKLLQPRALLESEEKDFIRYEVSGMPLHWKLFNALQMQCAVAKPEVSHRLLMLAVPTGHDPIAA